MTTRRTFVGQAVRGMGGLALGAHARALRPWTRAMGRTTPEAWLSDPTAAETLRALATQAIDAARQAGAGFADIRIGERRTFRMSGPYPRAEIRSRAGYGVRVLVDGTWGVARGETLTPDGVTTVARNAVATARGYAAVNARVKGRPVELAPTPAVTGEWTSPALVSPFTVSLDDHARVFRTWDRAIAPYMGLQINAFIEYEESTRVVASSDGTLITQYVTRTAPEAWLQFGYRRMSEVNLRVPSIIPVMAGFEAIMASEIPDQIVAEAEEVLRLARLPERAFEGEGRLPMVLDGDAVATVLGMTLGQALDGDRVAGLEADAAGRSFIRSDARGAQDRKAQFSPLVTVTADRSLPAFTAVQWDDEGVAPRPMALIERGQVRAFVTTRETAASLDADGRSTGGAVAADPMQFVMSGGAHLTVTPSATRADLDTLMRGMTRGILCYGGECLPEPNLSTGLFRGRQIIEVRAGRPFAHIHNVTFQFQTRRWWSDRLRALGDADTMRTVLVKSQKGMPWQEVTQVATAPAALLADVDTVRTDVRPL